MASMAPYDRDADLGLELHRRLPSVLARGLHDPPVDEPWWPLIRVCMAVAVLAFLLGVVATLEWINW